MEEKITGILLAAGLSTRMGTPKQLLPFGNSTMIETVIDNLLQSKLGEVIVIIGHQADLIRSTIKSEPIQIIFNPNFYDGMLSSVQCGIRSVSKSSSAFAITLVDQPLITPDLIDIVITAHHENNYGITIPRFNGQRGHPAIFDRQYTEEILELDLVLLVARGVDIRDVVRNHVQVQLLSLHAGRSGIKGEIHGFFFRFVLKVKIQIAEIVSL